MPFFEKNLSKNIPRGEKEIGLKMESEKSSSLSLPRRMRRSREQLYLRIKCSSPRRIVQKSWFSFGEARGAEGKKMRVLRNGKILKKISLKLISEQFNFALDPQLVKLSRLF